MASKLLSIEALFPQNFPTCITLLKCLLLFSSFFKFFASSTLCYSSHKWSLWGLQHLESGIIPLCFAGRDEMRYGWWRIDGRSAHCWKGDTVQMCRQMSTSGNNRFSLQDDCSNCMLFWLNEQPLSQLFKFRVFLCASAGIQIESSDNKNFLEHYHANKINNTNANITMC